MCEEKGIKYTGHISLDIILAVIFPILPINVVSLSLMQHNVNKLLKTEEIEKEEK